MEDNWYDSNENQGFDSSCFEKLIQSGWKGDTKQLRKALNTFVLSTIHTTVHTSRVHARCIAYTV